ncbi:MAG: NADH:flavin oxidoreductase [Lentisphaerae bacterium GWF2_52_8]|nr:MAG: NADH:flavin oxidoreductase [Lentisphaerae bacterium GWF2_52_8]
MQYKKIASLKTADDFLSYAQSLGIELPFDKEMSQGPSSPLAQTLHVAGRKIGNRFAVLPMEGWDCLADGRPSELTLRRWRNFGLSGAKLIWGGEAAAVQHDGRSNPRQLMIDRNTVKDIENMRKVLLSAHAEKFGKTNDLLIGLQLTHSGRFSRPNEDKKLESKIVYRHPVLDRKFNIPQKHPVLSDNEISGIIKNYVEAARLSQEAGFDFVDVKHCHGYLGHEFLSAIERPGPYGGSFENRTRFLREIVAGIRREAPGLLIGVRLSLFDFVPFRKDPSGVGEPEPFSGTYPYAFGGDGTGQGIELREVYLFLDLLASLGIEMVCSTAGSPYYNPHIQRPALFPPCDGYLPPEDPLRGVARQLAVAGEIKKNRPNMTFVGTGYTYLQEWLPNVAQAIVGRGLIDSVGLGRMVLPYPDIVADILEGRPLKKARLCRTFSDCTTAPRNGMVSGCYPLDPDYKCRPEHEKISEIKRKLAK